MKLLFFTACLMAFNLSAQVGSPSGTGAGSGAVIGTDTASYNTGASTIGLSDTPTIDTQVDPQTLNLSPNPAPNLNQQRRLDDTTTLGRTPSDLNLQDRQSQEERPKSMNWELDNQPLDISGRPLGPGVK